MRRPTVGEWLQEWLAAKKSLRAGTVRSYESHIRLYFAPCVGYVPLDRLRVADVVAVFDYIDDLNETVIAALVRPSRIPSPRRRPRQEARPEQAQRQPVGSPAQQ